MNGWYASATIVARDRKERLEREAEAARAARVALASRAGRHPGALRRRAAAALRGLADRLAPQAGDAGLAGAGRRMDGRRIDGRPLS